MMPVNVQGIAYSTTQMRLERLTSLRLIAALAVFGFHATAFFSGSTREALDEIFGQGRSGVTFFFILSGFVLTWSSKSGDSAARFYRRRFARIYPVYIVTLAIASLLWLIRDPRALNRGLLTPFLLQAWFPDSSSYFAINVPAWSLSVEAFFYLIFPFAVLILRRVPDRWLWTIGIATVGTSLTIAALTAQSVGPSDLGSNTFAVWLAIYCPLSRLPEFVLGMTLALLLKRGRMPNVPWRLALVLAAGLWVSASLWPSIYAVSAFCMVPFGLLVVAAAQQDIAGTSGILTSKAAVKGGAISYCFYLIHHILVLRLSQPGFLALGFRGWPAFFVTLIASLLCAWVLHLAVEVPMDRRLRGGSGAQPRPTSAGEVL